MAKTLKAVITDQRRVNAALFDALDQAQHADTLDAALTVLQARYDYNTRLYNFRKQRDVVNVHYLGRARRVAFIASTPVCGGVRVGA